MFLFLTLIKKPILKNDVVIKRKNYIQNSQLPNAYIYNCYTEKLEFQKQNSMT